LKILIKVALHHWSIMYYEILIYGQINFDVVWIWIEMQKLDLQSKSKIQFWLWIVNHNTIQQTGFQSGLNTPAIQSSNTLTIPLIKMFQFLCLPSTEFVFETNKSGWLFLSYFWPLQRQASFFEAAGPVLKFGLSLNQNTISKFDHVKLIQIS